MPTTGTAEIGSANVHGVVAVTTSASPAGFLTEKAVGSGRRHSRSHANDSLSPDKGG